MHRILHALAALLIATALPAVAAAHPLSLWRIDGADNRVYLLGSVHLLREQDYPIPSAIYAAYEDADVLIMELDMDDLDPVRTQAIVNDLGLIKGGGTLRDLMGETLYAEAEQIAAELNIPLAMLTASEPWLAAITVEQLMLTRLGFNPAFGIEAHLAGRAGMDNKEILGLEDIEQQLGFLDSLSSDAQRSLLMQSLSEAQEIEPLMNRLIDAWRHGDVEFLESNMLDEMRQYAELYDALVVARNRDWTTQIRALLEDDRDYLIIVGALHLVGDDGVPAMLTDVGVEVVQLRQED